MQSLLNVVLCSLILLGLVIVRLVFRSLRPVETQVKCECCLLFCFRRFVAQMMAERIIKHGLFKVVFVGAIIKPRLEEIFLWTSWFMVMGFLRLIASTVRDRVEFMTFSSANTRTTFVRFYILLALLVATNVALAGLAVSICYPAGLFAVALVLHEVPFFFFFLCGFLTSFFFFSFFLFFLFWIELGQLYRECPNSLPILDASQVSASRRARSPIRITRSHPLSVGHCLGNKRSRTRTDALWHHYRTFFPFSIRLKKQTNKPVPQRNHLFECRYYPSSLRAILCYKPFCQAHPVLRVLLHHEVARFNVKNK